MTDKKANTKSYQSIPDESSRPLLGPNDVESGNNNQDSTLNRLRRGLNESKYRKALAIAFAILLFLVFSNSLFHRRGCGTGPGSHRSHGHTGGKPSDKEDWASYKDGKPLTCAVFDEHTIWSHYPSSSDHSHLLVTGSTDDWLEEKSTNKTFYLPTSVLGNLFVHAAGQANIAETFVKTYPASGPAQRSGDVISKGESKSGHQVTVIVEPIVSIEHDQHLLESLGYAMLQASSICLMEDKGTNQDIGVGIYTHDVPNHPDHRHGHVHTPLRFRVHIFLPEGRGAETVKSLYTDLGVGSHHVDDITSVSAGELNFHQSTGAVRIDKARAEIVRISTSTGSISGLVEVSNMLEVASSTGGTRLDVTLASYPKHPVFPLPKSPRGALPPVGVHARTDTGTIVLKHIDWEEWDRTLLQTIESSTGRIETDVHPSFEGPFHLSTSTGSIDVEIPREAVPDPAGKGRTRVVTLSKHSGVVSKDYTGDVKWESKGSSLGDKEGMSEGAPGLRVKTSTGSIHVNF